MARAGMIRVDVSDAIVNETVHVLRDKFAWSGERLQEAKRQIASFTNLVKPSHTLDVIKEDPDDNRVLECAQTAGSDFVVSEDKDLLRLLMFGGAPIVRTAEFLERLIERPSGQEPRKQVDQ